jgi:hypothetical protein
MGMSSENEQITGNQHFVPKFYFKPFANDKKMLEVFDVERIKVAKSKHYKAVCFEKFFYAVNTGVADKISQELEEMFRQMENQIAPLILPIIKKILNHQQILEVDMMDISTFMSMLWLRNPVMRKQINLNNESVYKQMRKMTDSEEEIRKHIQEFEVEKGINVSDEERETMVKKVINQEYTVEFTNASHLKMIGEMEGFRNLLFYKKWNVYLARGKMKFITSDAPVVEIHSEDKSFWGNHFMDRKHYLALSPEILIETVINSTLPTPENASNFKRIKRVTLYDKDEKKVTEFNLMIASHCHKYSYSQSRYELEAMLRKIDRKAQSGDQYLRSIIRNIIQ